MDQEHIIIFYLMVVVWNFQDFFNSHHVMEEGVGQSMHSTISNQNVLAKM
jgi:hypothetical protein